MKIASCSFTRSCPTKSSSFFGRSERSSSSSALQRGRVLDPLDPGCPDPAHRAALSAPAISSSGVSPAVWSSSLSASCGVKPRPSRPSRASVRGSSERGAAHDDVVGGLAGHLLAQLDDDALRGALADAGHGLEAGGVAGGDRVQELARRAAGQHGERHLRPHALHPDQHQEQLALGLGWRSRRGTCRRRAGPGA